MAAQGDHAAAEAEFRDVLAAGLRVLGPDHPYTLATRHEIARMMAARGDHAGAEAEYRDVLAAQLRVLGPDHPDTLVTRHEIARVMAARGDHAGAEAEFRDVLAARLRVLGPDHRDTLTTRHEIAWVMARGVIMPGPRPSTATFSPPGCGCWAPTTRTHCRPCTRPPGRWLSRLFMPPSKLRSACPFWVIVSREERSCPSTVLLRTRR